MNEQKQQLITRLKEATNVLVTVSNNPSVDQLSGAIGLTLVLNKLNKHATAVFSGQTPPIISFLQPEKTLEKNTDSLRDFIISLDRSKADKLRYKVEDTQVKIFISPYRTSIHESDLNFSQGDFNVDLVIALGVHEQTDIDKAISSHGRILHDATVATINMNQNGSAGSINWLDEQASSLCEMLGHLVDEVGENLLDGQTATAFLTGLVAETDRFSNEKTNPASMTLGSRLLKAGADQQLVAEKLQPPAPTPPAPEPAPAPEPPAPTPPAPEPAKQNQQLDDEASEEARSHRKKDDGTLHISHDQSGDDVDGHQIHIDEHGNLQAMDQDNVDDNSGNSTSQQSINQNNEFAQNSGASHDTLPKIVTKPQGAMLPDEPEESDDQSNSANNSDEEEPVDPLSSSDHRNERILSHNSASQQTDSDEHSQGDKSSPENEQNTGGQEQSQDEEPQSPTQTLSDIEQAVGAHQQTGDSNNQAEASSKPDMNFAPAHSTAPSPSHRSNETPAELDEARQAIMDAADTSNTNPDQALPPVEALNAQPVHLNIHPNDTQNTSAPNQQVQNPNQPPPVPPPMMPPSQANQNQ